MTNETKEINIYRDTVVRYLGYANEVGEAFRSLVPKYVVLASYGISSLYVCADTIHGARKVYHTYPGEGKTKFIALSSIDTLLWQAFASVIIPGFTINRLCAFVQLVQKKSMPIGIYRSPWVSTIIGLASIPLIIKPIDRGVDKVMDITYRNMTGYHPDGTHKKD